MERPTRRERITCLKGSRIPAQSVAREEDLESAIFPPPSSLGLQTSKGQNREIGVFTQVECENPQNGEETACDPLRVDPPEGILVAAKAVPVRARRRKTMSRRIGQNGTVEVRNGAYRGRWFEDVAGWGFR